MMDKSCWFGDIQATPEEKTQRVRDVFDSVADRYDVMNDLMSLGIHRLWKNRFVRMARPHEGQRILDLAGGTGDIARRLLTMGKNRPEVIVCDINESMIRIGRDRLADYGFVNAPQWVVGNAETLPFADESFDLVTISFGLRNITHIDSALAEIRRILKTGGRFLCLEFSNVTEKTLRRLYDAYSFSVLPRLGEHIASDRESYVYLAQSIRNFPDRTALAKQMEKAGFANVTDRALTGGITAIHSGWVV